MPNRDCGRDTTKGHAALAKGPLNSWTTSDGALRCLPEKRLLKLDWRGGDALAAMPCMPLIRWREMTTSRPHGLNAENVPARALAQHLLNHSRGCLTLKLA